jgi:hypothetical protein
MTDGSRAPSYPDTIAGRGAADGYSASPHEHQGTRDYQE